MTTPNAFRFAITSCAALLMATVVHAQTAIITKARAHLGTEAALEAVKSIHYMGKLVAVDDADPKKKTEATVDIIFQKPDRHRITVTSDKAIEVTALDGYEGWQRVQDVADPAKWRQTLATADQIKRIRANTWENVSFFRGIETRGGRIEVLQPTTANGVASNKLAFIYAPNIVFYRYFDEASGKLILSETENGSSIREEGEIVVNGIRFPKSIITTNKSTAGKTGPTVTITFDQIKVNETFPNSVFAVPMLNQK